MLNLKSCNAAKYTPGVLDDYDHSMADIHGLLDHYSHPMADIRVALDHGAVVHKVVAGSY